MHLSALLAAKKFRGRGNKGAALAAFHDLEVAGLGRLESQESRRGTATVCVLVTGMRVIIILVNIDLHPQVYTFLKEQVQEHNLDHMVTKLAQYGMSISQYQASLQQEEIVLTTS